MRLRKILEILCQVGEGRVVPGLELGVLGMCRGETRQEDVTDVRTRSIPQEPPGSSSTGLWSSWGEDTAG